MRIFVAQLRSLVPTRGMIFVGTIIISPSGIGTS